MTQTDSTHLIDFLNEADVRAPNPAQVAVQPIVLAREQRMCLFAHPPASVVFKPLTIAPGAKLRFGCALKSSVWDKVQTPVHFKITARVRKLWPGREETIFEHALDVRESNDRRWHDFEVELARFAGQNVALTFSTFVPPGNNGAFCWSAWSDPIIESQSLAAPSIQRAAASTPGPVLLITSDALRVDHLGCYGHPQIKTPHLDRLAREGVLFEHARAHTPTTLGSFATLLTSRFATTHGLVGEWGRIQARLTTLPEHLSTLGYRTIAAPSEAEVGEDPQGLCSYFNETIPCLAAPAQEGAITVRAFLRRLDAHLAARPDQPLFVWLQFFDTHPPAVPPEPFRSLYYDGDPTDPARRYLEEAVGQIRGTESVLEIDTNLPALERGKIDVGLVRRLEATAAVLKGELPAANGPDLGAHLIGLGETHPECRRGLSHAELGRWLGEQAALLRNDEVSPELLEWLRAILPALREIEGEILAWLDGVTDYRYALAQYAGEVSYLDHHVGDIIAALEARGLYDNATIFFTSPHGESLGEAAMYFHHHALVEPVLRIPAIFKPAFSAAYARGARVGGVLDQADIAATLLEAVGAPPLPQADGVSRWAQAQSGEAIPEHDSFAVDYQFKMMSLTRPPHAFYHALAPHHLFKNWQWRAGEKRLIELTPTPEYSRDQTESHPDLAHALAERLEIWRRENPLKADR